MLSGLGPVEYGYPKQYSIESGTYCGEIEYISRSAQSDKNTAKTLFRSIGCYDYRHFLKLKGLAFQRVR
jgi:hypothetical protein